MKKKVVSLVMVLVMMGIFTIPAIAMTQSQFDNKLSELKKTYYHGKQQSSYEEGSTCFGYAYMIAKSVFGTSAKTWSKSYDLNGVKAGDVVQYGNTSGQGHTIFVTKVSGDTITYTDCNSDWNSTIKWNQTVSKSSKKIWSYSFSYRCVAPSLEKDDIVDIGDKFCANLIQRTAWATIINNNGNVEIGNGVGDINEYWWFERQSDGSYMIESLYDNKYLDVSGAGTSDSTNIQTCVTTGSDAQKWYVKNGKYGYVLVPKHAKSSCLDCAAGYPTVGTNVKLWSQNGTEAQGLSIYKQENWKIENIGYSFCANLIQTTAWATIVNNNGNVEIGNGVGAINEYWWFKRQSDGSYLIKSLYDNKYLDVSGAGTTDDTNIQTCVTTGSDAQKWYIKNGAYGLVLVPKHAKSSCLDCAAGYPTVGTNVKLWSQNGTQAQGLSIYKQENSPYANIMKNEIKNDDKYYKLNVQFSYLTTPAVYAAASYTADGQLLDIRTAELTSGAQSARATLPKADGMKYIKVFLWDSAEAMNPLAECETLYVN